MRARRPLRALTLTLVVLLVGLSASGCLRRKYNLCLEDPPHPDCPFDAGFFDAGPDAALDAPVPPDAGTGPEGDAD